MLGNKFPFLFEKCTGISCTHTDAEDEYKMSLLQESVQLNYQTIDDCCYNNYKICCKKRVGYLVFAIYLKRKKKK